MSRRVATLAQLEREEHGVNKDQLDKVRSGRGFIAALDQSGGSTPKALKLYGIDESQYATEVEMFDRMHAMRSRIVTSPAFDGDRLLAAILFEQTMDREIEGRSTADFLWQAKQVVPFIKVDKGVAAEADGVQLMKPIPGLEELLDRSVARHMFGTKARSVVTLANKAGISAIVEQQFDLSRRVLARGLVPILEPEVDIHSSEKPEAEALLKDALLAGLDDLDTSELIMLKLSLPSEDNFFSELAGHPHVLRVVALSGGDTRNEACAKLSRNKGMIASFSRALTEGLTAQQSNDEFNQTLDSAIQAIYDASIR